VVSGACDRLPAEVREVCERLGIHDVLPTALRLIDKHFQPEQIRFEPQHDPEECSEWLGIRADVRGSVESVLKRYNACKNEWIATAPAAKLGCVAFLYNILDS
jgi:hypothetical protein